MTPELQTLQNSVDRFNRSLDTIVEAIKWCKWGLGFFGVCYLAGFIMGSIT